MLNLSKLIRLNSVCNRTLTLVKNSNKNFTTKNVRYSDGRLNRCVAVQNLSKHQTRSEFHGVFLASAFVLSFLGFSKKKDEEEDELIMAIKRSVLTIQQGDLKKAEQMLHIALRIAQQKQNADGITYVYDLLANVALENGELDKSEKLFVNVMQRILSSGVAPDDNKVIHMSLKLAEIYALKYQLNRKPEMETQAQEGFRFCIEGLQKKIDNGAKDDDTILLLSLASEGKAKMLAEQGQYSAARPMMQKALELSQQSSEDSEERQASLLSDLGALCSMSEDHQAALKYLHEAVAVGRKADLELLPAFLVNLGLLSLYKGLQSEANSACKEAWHIARAKKNKEVENEASKCLDEIKKVLGV